MIDPTTAPWYDQPLGKLQEIALFSICVAGKNAKVIAQCLRNLLRSVGLSDPNPTDPPFELIKRFDTVPIKQQLNPLDDEFTVRAFLNLRYNQRITLAGLLHFFGIGCYNLKAKAIHSLIDKNLDLETCSVKDLESVYGIGPKTARFFILHTRRNANVACLDTHILKWLSELGFNAPKNTPSGNKYLQLEKLILAICKLCSWKPADLDISIWLRYAKGVRSVYGSKGVPTSDSLLPTREILKRLIKAEPTLENVIAAAGL